MIARSYAIYCRNRQTKQLSNSDAVRSSLESQPFPAASAQPSSTTTASSLTSIAERLQPDKATRRLIGLLSADCELTFDELEQIISYLKLRQKVIVSTKGLSTNRSPDAGPTTAMQHSYRSDTNWQSSNTAMTTAGSVAVGNVPPDMQLACSLLLQAAKMAGSRP